MSLSNSKIDSGNSTKIKKIDSPFAKYNSIGQLSCILCNQGVKNELLWSSHIISKSHLENKNKLKSKITTEQQSKSKNQEEKTSTNVKSTLKRNNSSAETGDALSSLKIEDDNQVIKKQKLDNLIADEQKQGFDEKKSQNTQIKNDTANTRQTVAPDLPEGFFDDRELDNQIRGVNKEQNLNNEYEEFKRMIQNEELKGEIINLKDDEIRDVDRDLEEVEELITRWKKIENLHQKREELLKKKMEVASDQKIESSSETDDSDVDLDSVLGLSIRAKKRC